MSQPQADQDLLMGLVALQNNLIDHEKLMTALSDCVIDKGRPLGKVLVDRGYLDTEKFQQLETLVAQHLQGTLVSPSRAENSYVSLRTLADDTVPETQADVQLNPEDGTIGGAIDDGSFARRASGMGPSAAGDRFQILRPHARGGLGMVSVALDRELDRSVAVKEIQDRYADHPMSRARFIEEAEITGKLEHPGVIPVYSLGHHADGRPYYAMRFIQGDSLKAAIQRFHEDENLKLDSGSRSLRLRELLRRFLDACNAIAYAHSRGIIHRDLKPDNIMLGPYGETLVVDWGLAKSMDRIAEEESDPSQGPIRLSSHSGFRNETAAGTAIGTPSYMSPEQADGRLDLIGPGTDVYGLGATLYHLLTGKFPVDGQNLNQILDRVRTGSFPQPRSIDPTIPTGLEAICLKAMATRLDDRYTSVQALEEDINRWLADETISAQKESAAQRLRRWLRKHPTTTAVSAALFLAGLIAAGVIIGIIARMNLQITRKATEARLNGLAAEHNLRIACLGTDALLTEVADVELADIPQMEPVRKRLLEKAKEGYQQFLDQDKNTPVLRWVSGRALGRLGEISELLGQYRESEQNYLRAEETLAPLSQEFPKELNYLGDLVRSRLGIGVLYKKTNRFREAERTLKQAAQDCEILGATLPEPYRKLQSDIDYQLGTLWAKSKSTSQAAEPKERQTDPDGEKAYRRAVEAQESLVKEGRGRPEERARLGRSLNNLGKLLSATGRSEQAESTFREAMALLQDSIALPGPRWQFARASHNLGVILLRQGAPLNTDAGLNSQSEEGLKLLEEAKSNLEVLTHEFPKIPQYRQELATISLNLGRIKRARKLGKNAQADLEQSLELSRQLVHEFPEIPDYRLELARATLDLATDLAANQSNQATSLAQEAIDQLSRLAEEFRSVPDYQNDLGRGYLRLARILLQADRLTEASSSIDHAIQTHRIALKLNPRSDDYLHGLRDDFFVQSIIFRQLGELAKSADAAEEMPRLTPSDLLAYYRAATLLVECASSQTGGDDYARRAVKVLKTAADKHLIQDPIQLKMKEFHDLMDREDFRKLLESVGPAKAG